MHKSLKLLRWLTALATLFLLFLFAWQCIDIYQSGSFHMDDVALRLRKLAVPLMIYAALLLVAGIMHMVFGQEENRTARLNELPYLPKCENTTAASEKQAALTRWLLCGLAVLFIVLGVMNGGWYDVLAKAINICTECIGLG